MQGGNINRLAEAQAILAANRNGNYTAPNIQLYPHQWLWDSCFVTFGLAEYRPHRAAAELNSLLDAQWSNGMVPHMIFNGSGSRWLGPGFWRTNRLPAAPRHVHTSGMTQPPLISIAALNVADKLSGPEAKLFLRNIYPKLVAYHQWLYRERDPHQSGLVVLVHSWESGLDNSPPWMETLNTIPNPLWLATFLWLKIGSFFGRLRADTQVIPAHQRLTQTEAVKLLYRAVTFRHNHYDSRLQLKRSWWLIEDITFNSILIAANRALFDIATRLGEDLPTDLTFRMQKSEQAIEQLWDESSGQYYSRNFRTQKLITVPSIGSLMPLFSAAIDSKRAKRLVALLSRPDTYWPNWPVPSVALDSQYFDQHHYWQGPTWINANWLIIQGLLKYGHKQAAAALRQRTLQLIEQGGFFEYFSPLSGLGYGANNFAWTAALYIHLSKLKIS